MSKKYLVVRKLCLLFINKGYVTVKCGKIQSNFLSG